MNADYCSADVLPLTDTLLEKFRDEVLQGLNSRPKRLQSKYFYDKEGDMLFQQIMACPEYYLTRCEREIFQHKSAELAHVMTSVKGGFDLIELGAGDATKSQYLLEHLAKQKIDFTYMPIDISGHILSVLESRLKTEIKNLDITCLEGEYFEMLKKAAELSPRRKVVMLLGANIGNMDTCEAEMFGRNLRAYLNPGDLVLVGFDLKKHPSVILDAYNDRAGITGKFNLNLLRRINRELNANFNLNQFQHYQTYDPANGACKSYLVSRQDQAISIGRETVLFARNETIFMEISQKYTLEETGELAKKSGFLPVQYFLDSKGWFMDAFWLAV